MTASTDDQCIPPLTQRIYSHMQREQFQGKQSQPGVMYASSFSAGIIPSLQSSSQRSSRLFDEMMEQQSQAVHRHNQSLGVSETDRSLLQVVEVTAAQETESVPK